MIIKSHYTVKGVEDCITIEEDIIEEIKVVNEKELKSRGIDVNNEKDIKEHNCWSEKLED